MGKQMVKEHEKRKEKKLKKPDVISDIPTNTSEKVEPIYQLTSFIRLEDIDLKLYMGQLSRLKIYSVALVDSLGQFIYYNKLAKEHFEGSLNNLKSKSIMDLMIPQSSLKVHSLLQEGCRGALFKCTIYSKNTKRKYLKMATDSVCSKMDIYYRYLKCLLCRVRPIALHFNIQKVQFEGNWIQDRVHLDTAGRLKCYLLQTRLPSSLEQLPDSILEDPIIMRFIQHSQKRLVTNRAHQCKVEGESDKIELENRPQSQHKQEPQESPMSTKLSHSKKLKFVNQNVDNPSRNQHFDIEDYF